MKQLIMILSVVGLFSCSSNFEEIQYIGFDSSKEIIIRGTSSFTLECSNNTGQCYQLNPKTDYNGTFSPSYTIAASTSMTASGTFALGTESNFSVPLGSITITTLTDNNLKQCGTGHNTQCSLAFIELYTTGTVAGLVSSTDSYGLPLWGQYSSNTLQSVGLNVAGAALMQTVTLTSSKHRINLSDFPSPTYNLTADTVNAETGTYTMTINVIYGLQ